MRVIQRPGPVNLTSFLLTILTNPPAFRHFTKVRRGGQDHPERERNSGARKFFGQKVGNRRFGGCVGGSRLEPLTGSSRYRRPAAGTSAATFLGQNRRSYPNSQLILRVPHNSLRTSIKMVTLTCQKSKSNPIRIPGDRRV